MKLTQLHVAAVTLSRAQARLTAEVAAARADGASWQEVAEILEVPVTEVRDLYGHTDTVPRRYRGK